MKIIDKINQELSNKKIFYSFEYFPPKTKTGLQNLYLKMESMSKLEPLFIDITWGAGGSTSNLTMGISKNIQQVFCLETQMHLTCTNINHDLVIQSLDYAKQHGIRNILALRGDPCQNHFHDSTWKETDNKFKYAIDLVKFIRTQYGNHFGISVAGYPEGHPDGNYQDDLGYLKQKVDAGADFIITQIFYDLDKFFQFIKDCRAIGITCPILPGILPIINYRNFKRMTGFCRVHVPDSLMETLEEIKNDDAKVTSFGIQYATKMCQEIIKSGLCGLHFYTLNRMDSCKQVIQNLGLLDKIPEKRNLPWKSRIDVEESIRPIFWSNIKKYYIDRTSDWNKFPNGRWGDNKEAQYGDINDYHLFSVSLGTITNKQKLWGTPVKLEDVANVFIGFLEKRVQYIPWCDTVLPESLKISKELIQLNKSGYFTINSQPCINGISSNNPVFGWGGTDGYLYQKAYLEFFCSLDNFNTLKSKFWTYGSNANGTTNISYCAVNHNGQVITNCDKKTINAVTWGVFPNKEIVQPTIVDYNSFLIWKKDAFQLWMTEWANIYDLESDSYKLIKHIHDTFYLVFIVDNNYINGDIFKLFKEC